MDQSESEVEGVKVSLAILMGLPASGKTTFAEKLKTHFEEGDAERPFSISVISYDDFVPHEIQAQSASLSQQNLTNLTKILRRRFIQCVESILKRINYSGKRSSSSSSSISKPESEDFVKLSLSPSSEAAAEAESEIDMLDFISKTESTVQTILKAQNSNSSRKLVLLIDDNNYYSSMRNDFYQLAKENRTGFCIIYCKTSLKTCRHRNSLREEKFCVPDKSIVEMSLKLEEPNPLSNVFDSYSVQITETENHDQDNLNLNLPLVVAILENSIAQPVHWNPPPDRSEEIERERRICSQNEVHQADQILRKWINKELSLTSFMKQSNSTASGNASGKRELSKDLNRKKTIVLDKLRSGEFKILAEIHQDLEFRKEVLEFACSINIE